VQDCGSDSAQIIQLADRHAAMAQQGAGHGDVEEEIGDREIEREALAGEGDGAAVGEPSLPVQPEHRTIAA
jgi:hypothetical protein